MDKSFKGDAKLLYWFVGIAQRQLSEFGSGAMIEDLERISGRKFRFLEAE